MKRCIRPMAALAPRVRHSIAQGATGATLGFETAQHIAALKGRHSDHPAAESLSRQPLGAAPGNDAPMGLTIQMLPLTQGSAALRPWAIECDPFGVENRNAISKLVANTTRFVDQHQA
jgi:hypothetical protein